MNVLQNHHTPLIHQEQTLESCRYSGFDLNAAIGELVDNSWEAKASLIRISTLKDESGSVTDLGIADNGSGIPLDILSNVLSLGYSSRYNSRKSLGRFGMGLKLAALSQGRCIEVYTKARGEEPIYRTFMDLDAIKTGEQQNLFVEKVSVFPQDFINTMQDPETKAPFIHGTLVIFRKIDRLRRGGYYGEGLDYQMSELTKFLARAYRRFIDAGLYIELDGRHLALHDPLFLMNNPRVEKKFGKDIRAKIIQQGEFEIDGQKVHWTVTLLPKEMRNRRGVGGRGTNGREEFKDLHIPDNQGKVSILRNGREIYYGVVPRLLPVGVDMNDRYIGVEISFPTELDEYFQVRNVAHGAEPIYKLREELKKILVNPIKDARKEVRRYWNEMDQQAFSAAA